MISLKQRRSLVLLGLIIILVLSACSEPAGPTVTPSPSPLPTDTQIPPVISVNGENVSRVDFEAELARYQQAQAALGNTVAPDAARQAVVNDLVDQMLLAQAAAAYGFTVDDAAVQSRIDSLTSLIGGADTLTAWQAAHGYTDADFRSALRRQIAVAWMRDRITASVPNVAEQVHVKQILLYNSDEANAVLALLQSGANFNDLAGQYDPLANGELGWFPRGYLTEKTLEDAAFALEAGKYSPIVQTESGYHLLYLVERNPARLLSPDALLVLQEKAMSDWLTQRRSESTINVIP